LITVVFLFYGAIIKVQIIGGDRMKKLAIVAIIFLAVLPVNYTLKKKITKWQ
jgi:hypothetical protein